MRLGTRSLAVPVTGVLALLVAAALPVAALAEATVKPDGRFRYALGAGGSHASGNTSATSLNLDADGVRATADSRWRFGTRAAWSRENGTTSAEQVAAGTRYELDFTPAWFGFGDADFLRDRFANISARFGGHGGVGRHLVRTDRTTFDVFVGAGYVRDRYVDPAVVDGQSRASYGRIEALVGEESSHRWTDTTSFRQKLTFYPSLRSGGGFRTVFDSGLEVAMTPLLSLKVGVSHRYDSDPGEGFKKNDTLFTTGIAVRID